MIIQIGADELILWLRKNEKAKKVHNTKLGRMICDKICDELAGKKIPGMDNHPAYWSTETGSKNIDDDNLPQTAEQYEIDTSKMDKLYEWLNTL